MSEIFLPSDLNRRGRAVLTAAREGGARIRDTDGTSLMVLAEERVQWLETVARAAANLALVEDLLDQGQDVSPDAFASLDWGWLRHLDREDLQEFSHAMRRVILAAFRDENPRLVDEILAQWRTTAQALADPVRKSILYRPLVPDDFLEVSRPDNPSNVEPEGP